MTTQTPLHDVARDSGASFQEWFSWLIVRDFGDIPAEYAAAIKGAALFDVSYVGKLRVTGRDRIRFLHSMLSNDVRGLKAGTGCHAALLTHQGRMESDLLVYADEGEIWLECPPAGTSRVAETLRKYVIADQVEIEDRTGGLAVLSIQGPRAAEVVWSVAGPVDEGLPELGHVQSGKPGAAWRLVRRDRTGSGGFDVWLPASESPPVWRRLAAVPGLRPAGHEALNRLRTEAGIPWFGVDMGDMNLPMEFSLDKAISLQKGCYRGQEIVARVTHRGSLDRRLGGIILDEGEALARGDEVLTGGTKVGEVTSAVFSPRLGKVLALAVLKFQVLVPGTSVEVKTSSGVMSGKVTALPLSS